MEEIFEVFGISIHQFGDSLAFDKAVSDMQNLLRNVYHERNQQEEKNSTFYKSHSFRSNISTEMMERNVTLECDCENRFNQIF